MRLISTLFLLSCILTPSLSGQSNFGPSLFAGYSLQRVNAGPGHCGCFVLNGGEFELALPTTRALGAVVDFGGNTAANTNGSTTGLSLFTLAVGPRLEISLNRRGASSRFLPFAEALAGTSHGFHSYFPVTGGATSATAFALVTGGGLNLRLSPHVALRPAQLDYIFTDFPNGTNNHQNALRFSTGAVLMLH